MSSKICIDLRLTQLQSTCGNFIQQTHNERYERNSTHFLLGETVMKLPAVTTLAPSTTTTTTTTELLFRRKTNALPSVDDGILIKLPAMNE